MAIENDAWQPDSKTRLRRGLAAEITLGLAAGAVFIVLGIVLILAGQSGYGIALLAFVPWLVPLVVQDYWRWMGFMRRRPGKALANDTVFNVAFLVAIAVLVVAHWHSIVTLTAAWGIGALAGALFGLWQYSVLPTARGARNMLSSRLHISKWLGANSGIGWGSSQATSIIAGFILGPTSFGHLRAAQTLVTGPTLVLVQAGGSVGLPEASASLANKGWPGLRRVARIVTAAGVLSVGFVAVVVGLFGSRLLGLIYGPEFSRYWLSSDFFVLGAAIGALGLGSILILKATKNVRALFVSSIITLIASLVAVTLLAVVYGVPGAAAASIPSSCVYVSTLFYFKRRARIDLETRPEGTSIS